MNWLATTILCIIVIEVAVRIPFGGVVRGIGVVSRKAMHVLGARSISDHWKAKAMLAYACLLFASSIKLGAFLVIVGAVAALLVVVADHLGATLGSFVLSWLGLLYSVIVATVYIAIRRLVA